MKNKLHPIRIWLLSHPAIKLTKIEEQAGIPSRTLQRFVGGRPLPERHIEALVNTLKKYGYK